MAYRAFDAINRRDLGDLLALRGSMTLPPGTYGRVEDQPGAVHEKAVAGLTTNTRSLCSIRREVDC